MAYAYQEAAGIGGSKKDSRHHFSHLGLGWDIFLAVEGHITLRIHSI